MDREQLKLSKEQEDVLYLLTNEFLTPKKIAIRRNTSFQAAYKTIKKLKEKGALNNRLEGVEKIEGTFQPPTNQIRLHAQEFNIKLLFKDQRYNELLDKSNIEYIDGNTIKLYSNSIEIYSAHIFMGEDVQSATSKSIHYWNRFFIKLEDYFNVILMKNRYQNIKLVKAHYSEINNELAKDYEVKGDKIKIFTRDDGKLWFLIDNSFNLHEIETVHPKTSKQDMGDVIKPYFNDLRENKHFLPSEVVNMIGQVTQNQQMFAKNIKTHMNVLNAMKNTLKDISTNLSKKPLKLKKQRVFYKRKITIKKHTI